MTDPTSKVVHLVRAGPDGDNTLSASKSDQELLDRALKNLDSMREALISGKIKAFFAVGLAHDHSTYAWSGKRSPTTVLELWGVWHSMAFNIDTMV